MGVGRVHRCSIEQRTVTDTSPAQAVPMARMAALGITIALASVAPISARADDGASALDVTGGVAEAVPGT